MRLEGTKAEVLGTDLLKLKASQLPALRRKIGVVFQDFQLLTDRTVDGNLHFVLEATGWTSVPEMSARKEEVLTMVGLAGRQREMPHRLSGGEQQKLAIARALLNKPIPVSKHLAGQAWLVKVKFKPSKDSLICRKLN